MRSLAPVVLLLFGCNYRIGSLHPFRSVAVPIFDNRTERRDHEFDLTRQVIRELSRQGIHVDPNSEHELRGEIVDIQQPVIVDDRLDNPRVSSFVMRVQFRLIPRKEPEKPIFASVATESATFSVLRGQSLESARSEVLDRLSKSIVSKFERQW